jgi:hypothetical protein
MSDKIPRECPRCGCDSVCCTCGYIDELRGVIEQEEDFEKDHDCGEDTCVHE